MAEPHPAASANITAQPEIPDFDQRVFADKSHKYALVVPVLNEGHRIQAQLKEFADLRTSNLVDIVIADGGSSDGSLDPSRMEEAGVRVLLTKTGAGRLSAQLRCAYWLALQEGYAGIITMDGNGKDSARYVPSFIQALEDGFDYAQASRFIAGGGAVNTPMLRTVAIRIVHAPIVSIIGRRWLTDTTQGYRAYSRRFLLDVRVQPFRNVFDGYELLPYLTVRACRLKFAVVEVPTVRTYPRSEAIPTKIHGWRAMAGLLGDLWEVGRGHFNPGDAVKP